MESYLLHQNKGQDTVRGQAETVDPTQLSVSHTPSLYEEQNINVLSPGIEQINWPFTSDVDNSGSIAVSPWPHGSPNNIQSAGNFNTQRDASYENFKTLNEHPRKRSRGSQFRIMKQTRQGANLASVNAPPSQASLKRAVLIAEHGAQKIASDGELKGETRSRIKGLLEWKEPSTGKWLAAAPHDCFRQEFIDFGITVNSYVHPPDKGVHNLDVTSNCSVLGQNSWTFGREGWDEIVDDDGNKVMYLGKAPARRQEAPAGKYWLHKGLVMLDPDDRPVLDWSCIPMTFSSKLEGGRMEALKRVFPWLKNSDFRARMPRVVQNREKNFVQLPKYSTFGQRLCRFRQRSGCSPWIERTSTMAIRKRKFRDLYDHADGDRHLTTDRASLCSTSYSKSGKAEKLGHAAIEDILTMQHSKRKQTLTTPTIHLGISSFHGRHLSPLFSDDQCSGSLAELSRHRMLQPPDNSSTCPHWYSVAQCSTFPHHQLWGTSVPLTTIEQLELADLRFVQPQSTADELGISAALYVTRLDFRSRYKFDASTTPKDESYFTQYQILQAKNVELWVIDENPPPLILIGAWYGSFEGWPLPQLSAEELQRLLIASEVAPMGNGGESSAVGADVAA